MTTKNALAWALVGLLLTTPANALLSSDGDPIPDDAESNGVPCGNALVQGLLVALGGTVGICRGPTDYEWHVFNREPCAACHVTAIIPEMQDEELVTDTDEPPLEVVPEVDMVIATLTGEYNSPVGAVGSDTEYCLRLEGTALDPLQCMNHTGILPPNTIEEFSVALVYYPGLWLDPPPTPRISMDLNVSYRYIEDNTTRFLGPGVLDYYWPVPVDAMVHDDLLWWLENGNQTSLNVDLVLYADGTVIDELHVAIPYLGQVLRAQVKSAEETLEILP